MALVASEPFDLVLSDVKMPGISGLELVRQIHFDLLFIDAETVQRGDSNLLRSIRASTSAEVVTLVAGDGPDRGETPELQEETQAVLRKPLEVDRILELLDRVKRRSGF